MKGLKQTCSLALLVAAMSPIAQAELKTLDDQSMSDVTGQAGVTIELETEIGVGSVQYIDEGNLSMNNIHIGGAGGGVLNNMKIDIDVNADGDAVIDVSALDGSNQIDFQATIGSVELNGLSGENTVLASNILAEGFISQLNLTVDTATDTLIATAGWNITKVDLDVDFLAIGIRNVSISSDNSTGLITDPTQQAINSANNSVFVTARVNSAANSRAASGQALNLEVDAFEQDIMVGAIEIGGTSIGTLEIQDQVISNTVLQVYGH